MGLLCLLGEQSVLLETLELDLAGKWGFISSLRFSPSVSVKALSSFYRKTTVLAVSLAGTDQLAEVSNLQ